MLTWDKPDERYYATGLDRGVAYVKGKPPVAWNGITGFDEGGSGETSILYRDGMIFLADVEPSDFVGKLTSIFFPDEISECLGMPEATDGFYVDNQKPKRFSFAYRTLVGSGTVGDMFGYQIHLVYNAMAVMAPRSRRTLGAETTMVEFNFDLVCTPVRLQGFRPTAHYVIDTRNQSPSRIAQLEALLYDDTKTTGLPDPTTLFDLMNFGDALVFRVHNNGTYTVSGSYKNLTALDADHFVMKNVNGVAGANGRYVISDGGTTDVIIE